MDSATFNEILDMLGTPSAKEVLATKTPEERFDLGNAFAVDSTLNAAISATKLGDVECIRGYACGLMAYAFSFYATFVKEYQMPVPTEDQYGELCPLMEEGLEYTFQQVKTFDENRQK